MRTMNVAIAALLLLSCQDNHVAEIAALRTQLAATQRELRDARVAAKTHEDVAALRLDQVKQEKARADELAARMERVRSLLAEMTVPAVRPGVAALATVPGNSRDVRSASGPPVTLPTWQDLETEQNDRQRQWREKLQNTTVYVGVGGEYHVYGCERLYATEVLRDGTALRKYIGNAITLQAAYDRRLSRDASCAPPSYDFSYK
jgi:hypothetical protein